MRGGGLFVRGGHYFVKGGGFFVSAGAISLKGMLSRLTGNSNRNFGWVDFGMDAFLCFRDGEFERGFKKHIYPHGTIFPHSPRYQSR